MTQNPSLDRFTFTGAAQGLVPILTLNPTPMRGRLQVPGARGPNRGGEGPPQALSEYDRGKV